MFSRLQPRRDRFAIARRVSPPRVKYIVAAIAVPRPGSGRRKSAMNFLTERLAGAGVSEAVAPPPKADRNSFSLVASRFKAAVPARAGRKGCEFKFAERGPQCCKADDVEICVNQIARVVCLQIQATQQQVDCGSALALGDQELREATILRGAGRIIVEIDDSVQVLQSLEQARAISGDLRRPERERRAAGNREYRRSLVKAHRSAAGTKEGAEASLRSPREWPRDKTHFLNRFFVLDAMRRQCEKLADCLERPGTRPAPDHRACGRTRATFCCSDIRQPPRR